MKTSLVILAAGMGSRFGGGVKQIAPVGPSGEIIIDYSIHDALEAGFDKVVFVIRRDIEKDFKDVVGNRIEKLCEVEYVYQSIDSLPYAPLLATDRKKPWGTTHAIWSARNAVQEPFLIINADDYYGKNAYKTAHEFLVQNKDDSDKVSLGMVGFELAKTLSENGGVTRGICKADENGRLVNIVETYNIERDGDSIRGTANGEIVEVDQLNLVSMNMWCFTPRIFEKAERELSAFLKSLPVDDIKSEHVLPTLVGDLLAKNEVNVKMLSSDDIWVGVTYAEDKPFVSEYFKKLISDGIYPPKLY